MLKSGCYLLLEPIFETILKHIYPVSLSFQKVQSLDLGLNVSNSV